MRARGASLVASLMAAVAWLAVPAAPLAAQRTAPITVTGVAFDSLHNVPLANAFVILSERGRTTTSDARGRFTFDSVPPGTYTFLMQHAVFDTLGLSGATVRAAITPERATVLLAVPSFPALWRAACGAVPAPARDTGLVYGSVRHARTRAPIPLAWVEVSWLDVVKLDAERRSTNITQRRWRSEVQADSSGNYAVCGAPAGNEYTVRAFHGTNTTGSFRLRSSLDRIRRQDIVLSGTTDRDATASGAIAGALTDSAGKAVANARIAVGELEARTDDEGRFSFRTVPAGTRQMEATAIGLAPVTTTVDIYTGDTARVALTTYRMSRLDTVRVRSSPIVQQRVRAFEERRRMGYGSVMDSTQIGRRATVSAAMQGIPGLIVQNARANGRAFNILLPSTGMGNCLAYLFVDGIQQNDHEILSQFVPGDIAAIEVYQHRMSIPQEFMRSQMQCGAVVVWTKYAFR